MTSWILGVGASHNGGASLLADGELVVSVQEERLTRVKRSRLRPAFDTLSIDYCLCHAGIGVEDLTVIGVARDEPIALPESDLSRNPRVAAATAPIAYVSHHRAHAAAAAYQSGSADAVVLVIDGLGSPVADCPPQERALAAGAEGWETLSIYRLENGRLTCLRKDLAENKGWLSQGDRGMPRFAGIGGMYSAVSHQLFGQYLEAGKVMGLAPFGTPAIDPDDFYTIDGDQLEFCDIVPSRFRGEERWPAARGEYETLAASVQVALERAVLWAAELAHRLSGATRLVYAGGVALNCLANERVLREGPFDDVFIMPAAEDSGTSLGAAVEAASERRFPLARRRLIRDAPGSSYARGASAEAVAAFAGRRGAPGEMSASDIAQALVDGKRVGWFSGGAELGPRALGQRSILADPRDPATWPELNRLKGREDFRPMAPMVLADHAEAWFEMGGNPHSPFMLRVCEVRADKRPLIPAVVHVDGTARVQTVERDQNPALHAVLVAFLAKTGVPVLLNTSFNAAGEPIVETPEDALWCGHRLQLDLVVLDGCGVKIGSSLGDETFVTLTRHRVRRRVGHPEPWGAEVEVPTPWGDTRHWLEGAELKLLERLRDGPRSVADVELEAGPRALEQLRRLRLVKIARATGLSTAHAANASVDA